MSNRCYNVQYSVNWEQKYNVMERHYGVLKESETKLNKKHKLAVSQYNEERSKLAESERLKNELVDRLSQLSNESESIANQLKAAELKATAAEKSSETMEAQLQETQALKLSLHLKLKQTESEKENLQEQLDGKEIKKKNIEKQMVAIKNFLYITLIILFYYTIRQ